LKSEVESLGKTLAEEKAARAKVETEVIKLQTDLSSKMEVVDELRAQLQFLNKSTENMADRVSK